MKPIDPLDYEAIEEINSRNIKIQNKINLANEQIKLNQHEEAKLLLSEAQNLCIYVGTGPKAKILNEETDRDMWHKIDKKIESLNIHL